MNINSTDWYSNMAGLTKEYASVRSSSYKKLLKKHYENQKNQETSSGTGTTEKGVLTEIKSSADSLAKTLNPLASKGKFSVFNKTEDGYDMEAIHKAVDTFVKDYNSMVDASVKTENTAVLRKTLTMVNTTKAYKNSLEKIGVRINSDNTLSIDEEKLKSASVIELKTTFSGFQSYGTKIMTAAAGISSACTTASLYTKAGSFTAAQGNSYNSYF